MLGSPTALMAQVVAPPPPGGTVADQFERPELPRSEPRAPVRVERPSGNQAASDLRFDVQRIEVQGVTALDQGEVRALAATHEGRNTSFAELSALADAITSLYASRGFALSFAFIPEQTVENGVVRLRVVEGTVDAVMVEFRKGRLVTSRKRVEAAIRRRFAPLVATGPVRTGDLERAALLSSDLGGIEVSVIVRPSDSVEGAATLVVMVDQQAIGGAIGADNRLRAEFGREEAYAALAVHSLLTVGDRIEGSFRRSLRNDGFVYGSAAYDAPVGSSGLRIGAFYSTARTQAHRGLLGLLEYKGREQSYRFDARYPLIRSRTENLFLSAELGAIDTRSELFGTTITREKIRTLAIGATYDWADGTGARNLLGLRVVQGLSALGATPAGDPLRSRAFGEPDAGFVTMRVYRDQPVAGFRVRVDSDTQVMLHGSSLPASSECTFGGPAIGRGYDAGAISGDQCWRGSIEVARPALLRGVQLEPYGFIDGGITRHSGRLEVGETRRSKAASIGFGLRLFSKLGLNADVQWAHTVRARFPGDRTDSRVFFAINLQR